MTSAIRRHAGLLVPLSAMPSADSWGVGEIGDLPVVAGWLRECGLDILQLLPVHEMTAAERSPYSALSAFAIDPIYISVARMPEFRAIGGTERLSAASRNRLRRLQRAPAVRYQEVRRLKHEAFVAAFAHFLAAEWRAGTARACDFERFRLQQAAWLPDYALFRALHQHFGAAGWTVWPKPVRDRDEEVLRRARREFRDRILFYEYLQWIAADQWREARRELAGVTILGDFPFMVSADSADVWSRQAQFDLDAQVGVPPDAFSATGQAWGLPVYRWDAHARDDYGWLHARARRCAELYDALRIDHVVGFYRTYVIPASGEPFFTPSDPDEQVAHGEQLMSILRGAGCRIVAEDLGTVPDRVRQSLARIGVPGLKVLRWERDWDAPGQPFRDPAAYPELSLATTGTHDTEPMRTWWEHASAADRGAALRIPGLDVPAAAIGFPFSAELRDGFMRVLFHAGSSVVIAPIQDVFGWSDRINVPGTSGAANWTYRLPWFVDRLFCEPEARVAATRLRQWTEESGRVACLAPGGQTQV